MLTELRKRLDASGRALEKIATREDLIEEFMLLDKRLASCDKIARYADNLASKHPTDERAQADAAFLATEVEVLRESVDDAIKAVITADNESQNRKL